MLCLCLVGVRSQISNPVVTQPKSHCHVRRQVTSARNQDARRANVECRNADWERWSSWKFFRRRGDTICGKILGIRYIFSLCLSYGSMELFSILCTGSDFGNIRKKPATGSPSSKNATAQPAGERSRRILVLPGYSSSRSSKISLLFQLILVFYHTITVSFIRNVSLAITLDFYSWQLQDIIMKDGQLQNHAIKKNEEWLLINNNRFKKFKNREQFIPLNDHSKV